MKVETSYSKACVACGSCIRARTFVVAEMLRGTREKFAAFECSECGCVQLEAPPDDMSKYYECGGYESFRQLKRSRFKQRLRSIRNRHTLILSRSLFGRLLDRIYPTPCEVCAMAGCLTLQSRVLDVGCGSGELLGDLYDAGVTAVSGLDPFISRDLEIRPGVFVRRREIRDETGKFDVLISHHSFEHTTAPQAVMAEFRRCLRPNGYCIITVPVAETLYREYREHCYLIQAPQHPFLPSIAAMHILGQDAGFALEREIRDSNWASRWYQKSELWRRNACDAEICQGTAAALTRAEIAVCDAKQRRERQLGLGDNVVFIFRKHTN